MEDTGFALALTLVLFACGAGLWNSVRIVLQKSTTVTASMALGEFLLNVIYCAIGVIFVVAFCTTDWQEILALAVTATTLAYILYLWVYATVSHTCSKNYGVVMTCFHCLRGTALAVAIIAAF